MFEKEAEEIANKKLCSERICYNHCNFNSPKHHRCGEWHRIYECAKESAELAYNKANEWHYVKDGDLPKENEYIMIYSKLADNIAVGKRRCAGKIRKRCVYEWYFATYEGTYCLRDKDIIAWKEIELPKEIGEK